MDAIDEQVQVAMGLIFVDDENGLMSSETDVLEMGVGKFLDRCDGGILLLAPADDKVHERGLDTGTEARRPLHELGRVLGIGVGDIAQAQPGDAVSFAAVLVLRTTQQVVEGAAKPLPLRGLLASAPTFRNGQGISGSEFRPSKIAVD